MSGFRAAHPERPFGLEVNVADEMGIFGINTRGIKEAYENYKQSVAALPPSPDPWVRALAGLIAAIAQTFGA